MFDFTHDSAIPAATGPAAAQSTDVAVRRAINWSAVVAIGLAAFAVAVALPLWNYLSLTAWFFRLRHHLRHDVLRKIRVFHGSRLYHNQALKICLFWGALAFACSFVKTGGDIIQITKRFGRIAVALMPPLLFLTLRPSPLPHTLYLSLIPIHKWVSRVVVLLSLLHTALYTWYWISVRMFFLKIKKPANLWGVIAMALFLLIAITSLSGVRRYNFRLFYYVHYVSTWLTVVLLHFHARPPVSGYTALNCCILVAQIAYRVIRTTKVRITVVPVSPNLILVEFPLSGLSKKPHMPSSTIRMAPYHNHPLKRLFQQLIPLQHPYTIASLPSDDMIRLIIRRGKFQLRNNAEYLVTGAFEPKIDFISKSSRSVNIFQDSVAFQNQTPALLASPLHYLISARRALIVTGGSAISFGLPLLRILNFNGVTVRLKWVTRDYRDLTLLNHFKNNFDGLEIYVTGSAGEEQDLQIDYVDFDQRSSQDSSLNEELEPIYPSAPETAPESNYGTFKSFEPPSGLTLQNQGRSNQEDEIDFTQMFSARSLKSKKSHLAEQLPHTPFAKGDIFRKPSIVVPPPEQVEDMQDLPSLPGETDPKVLKIPAGVQVFFGRPNLTNHDYQWCLERECIGPSDTNDCFRLDGPAANVDDLSRVWVLAAGPPQLVENTKRWATDGGLHFHEESFTS